jgi:hypothetical protein
MTQESGTFWFAAKHLLLWSTYSLPHRLCDLVVRPLAYRTRGPWSHSRRCQIFRIAVGLERVPLSLVRITEELLERESIDFGLDIRD